MIEKKQRLIFYPLQKRATQWLTENFERYTCNWQSFAADGKKVFENFTCVSKDGTIIIVLIEYRVKEDLDGSDFYTYKHQTSF